MKCALVSYWEDIAELAAALATFDKVFACEQAAFDLLQAGVKLEKIIGDFDSVAIDKFAGFAVDIEQLPTRKNETDTHALLAYIVQTYPEADVTLYNTFANRTDHALALLSLFDLTADLIIQTPETLMYRLKAGSYTITELLGYQYVSFIALSEIPDLTIEGLTYELAPTTIQPFSDLTVSNTFTTTGAGTIIFTHGALLVIYARDKM